MSKPTPTTNKALAIVSHASQNSYAIPALCCYNIEGILATVRAAETQKSPAIIQLFPWAIHFADGILVHAAAEAARTASVPVAVHMDHAQTPEIIRRAAEIGGFDGIMVDMSHYPKEENLRLTRELVSFLHERGIVTEAEPGRIEGGEDGVADTSLAALEGLLTSPEEAGEFMDTGIDWLAPAFGNVHGHYGPQGPSLDYPRLESIDEVTRKRGVALVLHGANGFDEPLFQECIKRGMAKANINDGMNGEWVRVLRDRAGKVGLTGLIEEGTEAMQRAVEVHMDWLGSTGKAALI